MRREAAVKQMEFIICFTDLCSSLWTSLLRIRDQNREVKGKEYHTGIHPSLGSVVDRNLIPKRRPDRYQEVDEQLSIANLLDSP